MKSMSRSSNILIAAAVVFTAACSETARIEGTLEGAPESSVVLKVLDINHLETIDTVATDRSGRFSCKVDVKKGQPEFMYVYHDGDRVASLIVGKGDRIGLHADTLGNCSVTGSLESEKMAQVDRDYAAVLGRMTSIMKKLETVKAGSSEEERLRKELGAEYVGYYRDRVRYVMSNSRSLTVVPVLYQMVGETLPVFAQNTDAVHFRSAADSLALSYPDSKYVKALRREAQRRMDALELESRLGNAEEIGFPDIELPDTEAVKTRLSEVASKAVLVCFWNPADAAQKMYNLDVLKPAYEAWHEKGFEIYQVALAPDKTSWARTVKDQKLPWISVCDGLGASSRYVSSYNISSLPAFFVINDGELEKADITDRRSLDRLLSRMLK